MFPPRFSALFAAGWILLATMMTEGAPAFADDCLDYKQYLHWLSTANTPGQAQDVAVLAGYAYVADGTEGLQVFDVSDPENPLYVSTYSTSGNVNEVVVSNGRAYLAEGDAGFSILDISDPAHPVRLGSLDPAGSVDGLDVSGDVACLAVASYGVHVVDVDDPAAPRIVGTVDTPGLAEAVTIDGNHAFVADGDAGVSIISISLPGAPFLISRAETPGVAKGVAVSGDYAYVVASDVFYVVDIAAIASPWIVGSLQHGHGWPYYDVKIEGSYAYVADRWGGLQILDVSDPQQPLPAFRWYIDGETRSVTMSGDMAFLAGGFGMTIIDIVPLAVPAPTGSVEIPTNARGDIALTGDGYACVAAGTEGMAVVDIRDPARPAIVGTFPGQVGIYQVALAGDVAYAGEGIDRWFHVVDISNPTAPVELAALQLPDDCSAIAADQRYAYLVTPSSGLLVIDPSIPAIVGSLDLAAMALGVTVYGHYVYVGNWVDGIKIIDVGNPAAPELVGSFDAPYVRHILIADGRAYVTCYSEGLWILDVSDPVAPSFVGSIDTPGWAGWVGVSHGFAYLSLQWSVGVEVIDVRDPSAPAMVSMFQTPGRFEEPVTTDQDFVYVYDRLTLAIYPKQCVSPAAGPEAPVTRSLFALEPAAPNPFGERTALRLVLPRAGTIEASVHDPRGRLVRVLVDGFAVAGPRDLIWDGTDRTGARVPSGVYFVACRAGGETMRRTIQVIR